jgi:hypothetical protein
MSAEIEIRQIDTAAFDLSALTAQVGPELAPGTSDTQFLVGTPDSGQVVAHLDRAHASISFYGSYSQLSEHKLELIERIAKHLKGQIYIEGEPASEPYRKLTWWQWLLWFLAAPLLLIAALIFLLTVPFLLLIALGRLCLACRRPPEPLR